MIQQTEFTLGQNFLVTHDPAGIDRDLQTYPADEREQIGVVMHRMYQALCNNDEAMLAVMAYIVLLETDFRHDTNYVKIHYGEHANLVDVLREHATIFCEEDQATLARLEASDVHPLLHAFSVDLVSFSLQESPDERA